MEKKPIESVMLTAMESIRDMIDVSTVVGEPVATQDGSTVIPVSRVSFGFAAGGADCENEQLQRPFAGGAGAGVSVQPVGFLVMEKERVRLLPAQYAAPIDRLIELAPQLIEDCRRYLREKNGRSFAEKDAAVQRNPVNDGSFGGKDAAAQPNPDDGRSFTWRYAAPQQGPENSGTNAGKNASAQQDPACGGIAAGKNASAQQDPACGGIDAGKGASMQQNTACGGAFAEKDASEEVKETAGDQA